MTVIKNVAVLLKVKKITQNTKTQHKIVSHSTRRYAKEI